MNSEEIVKNIENDYNAMSERINNECKLPENFNPVMNKYHKPDSVVKITDLRSIPEGEYVCVPVNVRPGSAFVGDSGKTPRCNTFFVDMEIYKEDGTYMGTHEKNKFYVCDPQYRHGKNRMQALMAMNAESEADIKLGAVAVIAKLTQNGIYTNLTEFRPLDVTTQVSSPDSDLNYATWFMTLSSKEQKRIYEENHAEVKEDTSEEYNAFDGSTVNLQNESDVHASDTSESIDQHESEKTEECPNYIYDEVDENSSVVITQDKSEEISEVWSDDDFYIDPDDLPF